MYNEFIQKDIDALEREEIDESDDIRKYNTFDILSNAGSIFTGAYLNYKDVATETMFGRNIAERIKLRQGKFDEIKRAEENMNTELLKA